MNFLNKIEKPYFRVFVQGLNNLSSYNGSTVRLSSPKADGDKVKLSEKNGNQENDGIEYIFHPRSVAVAGVSGKAFGLGHMLLSPFLKCGFKGNIYPLNPNGGKIWGLKIYSSLKEIPGKVDYVILSIPASLTPQFMEDCVA